MTLAARCRLISTLILDVDGVLTSGQIVYTEAGHEIKAFHVRDGSAIKLWQKSGKQLGILSGRNSAVTSLRAKELGIKHVEQGNAEKGPGLASLIHQFQVESNAVAYMGDDLADVPVMKEVGLPWRRQMPAMKPYRQHTW